MDNVLYDPRIEKMKQSFLKDIQYTQVTILKIHKIVSAGALLHKVVERKRARDTR